MSHVIRAVAAFALVLCAIPVRADPQSRLLMAQPNARTPVDAFNDGVREGQERRQRDLDYQAQLDYIRTQQQLRALSAEFWASDTASKWQILPQIAALDPELAAQYQASMPITEPAASSVVYRCSLDDGSVVFTAIASQGCIVISANTGQ